VGLMVIKASAAAHIRRAALSFFAIP